MTACRDISRLALDMDKSSQEFLSGNMIQEHILQDGRSLLKVDEGMKKAEVEPS